MLLFCFLGCWAAANPASAQRVRHTYTSHLDSSGTLYYLYPIKDFKGKQAKFTFDITCHTTWDSAVLRFTLVEPERVEAESLELLDAEIAAPLPVKRMFVDRKGKKWSQRYEATLPLRDLRRWVDDAAGKHASRIRLNMKGGRTESLRAGSAWPKRAAKLQVVMELVELNRP